VTAPLIGIDLGTTNSLLAIWDGDRPRVLTHELGSPLVPSVVAVDATGHVLVGAPAKARQAYCPSDAVSRFKPAMGTDTLFTLGGQKLGPVTLSSLVLRELREMAEAQLGAPARRCVVTVPAWFREPQRRATLDAALLAGLDVRLLLNEPTAAALAHGLAQRDAEQTIIVLDLGGGTFDVTVLDLYDGVVDVRGSGGDVHLGGEDVTDALVRATLRLGQVLPGPPEVAQRLRARVEAAKRALATTEQVSVDLSEHGGGAVVLTRDALDQASAALIERAERCVRDALVAARLTPAGVHEVLLVGGSSRLPWMTSLVRRLFRKEPLLAQDVDYDIAHGAAAQAALLARHAAVRERSVTDVLTHSLGVAVVQTFGGTSYADRFSPVLPRGSTLPIRRSERFWTLHHEQSQVRVRLYEGEERDVSGNELIGELVLRDLPTSTSPDHREAFDLVLAQDTSGLLAVTATVLSTQQTAQVVLERTTRALSDAERAQAERDLDRLRTHPRALLHNRLLLERANALVPMLAGPPRAQLEQVLLAFEAALDTNNEALADQVRPHLARTISALRAAYDLGPE
jgi:molecular chaperone HscC